MIWTFEFRYFRNDLKISVLKFINDFFSVNTVVQTSYCIKFPQVCHKLPRFCDKFQWILNFGLNFCYFFQISKRHEKIFITNTTDFSLFCRIFAKKNQSITFCGITDFAWPSVWLMTYQEMWLFILSTFCMWMRFCTELRRSSMSTTVLC